MGNIKWQIRYHKHSQCLGSGSKNWTTPKRLHGHTTWTTKQSQQKRRILKRNHDSKWAATTFIQPNKAAKVRALTDFRQLNQAHKRQPFPLPKISEQELKKVDMLQQSTRVWDNTTSPWTKHHNVGAQLSSPGARKIKCNNPWEST
jgi:hypothetical protein